MANGTKKKDNAAENSPQGKISVTKPKFDSNNAHKDKTYKTNVRVTEGTSYKAQGLGMKTKPKVVKEEPKKPKLISKDGWLVIHGAIGILLLISIFGLGGIVGVLLRRFQIGLFGIAGYVFPMVYVYCAFILLGASDKKKVHRKIATIALTMVSISSLVFLMVDESLNDGAKLLEFYFEDSSCGAIGGLFGGLVKNLLSRGGGFVVFLALLVFCAIYLSNKSLHEKIQTDGFGVSGLIAAWNRFKTGIESRLDEEEDEDADYGIDVDTGYMEQYEPDYFEETKSEDARRRMEAERKAELEKRAMLQQNRRRKVSGVNFQGLDMKPLTNTEAVMESTKKAQQIAKKKGFLQEENDFFGGISFLKKSGLFGSKSGGDIMPESEPVTKGFRDNGNTSPAHRQNRQNSAANPTLGSLDEYMGESGTDNELPFDERTITTDEDLTRKSGFSTPEEAIRSYRTEIHEGSIVKPKRYEEVARLDEKDENLDEETIRKVKEILARRGEIVLTDGNPEKAEETDAKPEIVIHGLHDGTGESVRDEPSLRSENRTGQRDDRSVHGEERTGQRSDRSLHGEERTGQGDEFGLQGEIRIHRSKEEDDSGDFEEAFEEEIIYEDFDMDSDFYDEEEIVSLPNPDRTDFSAYSDKKSREPKSRVLQTEPDSHRLLGNDQKYGAGQSEQMRSVSENAGTQQIRIQREDIPYTFPPNSLLARNPKMRGGFNDEEFRMTAMKLQQTLKNFGVNVTVTDISIGPVVTRYELQPELGVKVNKIVNLADDIKLSLAAKDIRIQAPIPGKPAVGIEVPNKESSIVYFRDLIETEDFRSDKYRIAFAIGKDIAGKPVITDIANMPHLLIAGATGSGKSVCINTMIMSILYKYSPSDVKMIMIDPKVVELSVYNGIPHLLIPVVTEAKKAAGALNWAVAEMSDRFRKFAEINVRNIRGYNKKIEEAGKRVNASELPKKMPNIVIVIDELADLMMVAQNEVESSICRIAQLARACGIHLVIATQRPSVNVITGLIKANIPTRIAFAVSSAIDSRTILDAGGAEKLLGKGDMLFNPPGGIEHIRIQGAFISDNEVQEVVEYVKNQGFEAKVDEETVTNIVNTINTFKDGQSGTEEERDELFASVGRYIVKKKKAYKGNLQIVFKIGFNRSARIIEQLYQAGVVGDDLGTKPREVLMDEAQFEDCLRELNLS